MHHAVDAELRDEAKRFSLVFTCRRCAHFAAGDDEVRGLRPPTPPDQRSRLTSLHSASPGRCSLEFPVEPHLDVDLETAERVTFCKAFELW